MFRIIHDPNYLSLTVILPCNKVIVPVYFILPNGIIFTPAVRKNYLQFWAVLPILFFSQQKIQNCNIKIICYWTATSANLNGIILLNTVSTPLYSINRNFERPWCIMYPTKFKNVFSTPFMYSLGCKKPKQKKSKIAMCGKIEMKVSFT